MTTAGHEYGEDGMYSQAELDAMVCVVRHFWVGDRDLAEEAKCVGFSNAVVVRDMMLRHLGVPDNALLGPSVHKECLPYYGEEDDHESHPHRTLTRMVHLHACDVHAWDIGCIETISEPPWDDSMSMTEFTSEIEHLIETTDVATPLDQNASTGRPVAEQGLSFMHRFFGEPQGITEGTTVEIGGQLFRVTDLQRTEYGNMVSFEHVDSADSTDPTDHGER